MTDKPHTKPTIQLGRIKRHPDGFGFFIPDDSSYPDAFVPRKSMIGIMSNDRVEVMVYPEPGGDRFRCKIEKVIERCVKVVTGPAYQMSQSVFKIHDESFTWGEDLTVLTEKNEFQIQDGDWVAVEILHYPGSEKGFQGRAIEKVGQVEDPLNDNIRVLIENGIPYKFTKECLAEAKTFKEEVVNESVTGHSRRDLRELKFITIDGATAKDFDDAILVLAQPYGFLLYVAIADVSHYVRLDSEIDKEAYSRGTSTYFPNFVSPMLPEELSNELCSLKPEVDRLAFVAEMKIDRQGHLFESNFYEAIIQSHARVTYGEAQEVIDGGDLPRFHHVKKEILIANDLAKILLKKRTEEGTLELEIPEIIVEVDAEGVPQDIIQAHRLFSHRLIEELMLMANVAVAQYFTQNEVEALYRIHEPPKEEAIEILHTFMENLGQPQSLSGAKLQKKITKNLERFRGTPQEQIINILTLRSMSQAQYSPDNVGHFGLGFSDYTHFTSPIRRYPDLIVHRLLKASVYKKGYQLEDYDRLKSNGTFLSACEQRSVKAQRQIEAIKKARFMHKHLGDHLEGFISSVTKFGVFVSLREYAVDGLVKLEELTGDFYEFNEEHLLLIGRKTGVIYSIGDDIVVQVAAVNIELGQIDFKFVELKVSEELEKNKDKLREKIKKEMGSKGPRRPDYKKSKSKGSAKKSDRKNRKNEDYKKPSKSKKKKSLLDYLEESKSKSGGSKKKRSSNRPGKKKRSKRK